ncbi:MAG TPA: cytochrome c [Arenicellales bacterium]|nr:cytochrome c [Arenicellales bacterium]
MLKKLLLLMLSGSILALPMLSVAQQDKDPVISYRQKVMQSIGANIGAISDVLKYSLPRQDNIPAHAEQMRRAAALIPSAFEDELSEGPTDAKPEIWESWDEFQEYAGDLEQASAELAAMAADSDTATFAAQVKKVGDTCKQCHDEFRKPKEESYKQNM